MMIIERQDKPAIKFASLSVGDVYRDEAGRICIKLSDNDTFNSLTFGVDEDIWTVTSEYLYAEITPLKAKLTVWEEKEI